MKTKTLLIFMIVGIIFLKAFDLLRQFFIRIKTF